MGTIKQVKKNTPPFVQNTFFPHFEVFSDRFSVCISNQSSKKLLASERKRTRVRKIERNREKEKERNREKKTQKKRNRETEKQGNRETECEKQRNMQRNRET